MAAPSKMGSVEPGAPDVTLAMAVADRSQLTERQRAAQERRLAKRAAALAKVVAADAAEPIALGSSWLAAWRLAFYVGLTLPLMPVQLLLVSLGSGGAARLPLFYHRLCCRIFGFDIRVIGEISTRRPTLYVCNHTSYLDIPVLGSILPASFVAKTEVASWPGFGLLAKLQRTVFVDRRRGTSHQQREQLQERLDAGDNLILFPEGTSNDGNRVLPFRSALLSVAEARPHGQPLTVQPVSISYVGLNGLPLGHGLRPLLAWYGDMTLGGHLWTFCRLGRVRVVVEFHPVTDVTAFPSRKELTRYCLDRVADGVSRAIAGLTGALSPVQSGTVKKD
ncbi:lysophospholipid acyltransferase family protein [Dongia soli]|uniref:Lysophospholipid acyltransferase family protein n=1 Tax=Dongia soli TaxID=600628 RepID=A0ABU5E7M5_9PROT|nr:lysophospholipid acyltransferase family protein [Dongia soli]MDY0882179.1 lysophospholipid acyltransferase family protein [Dongia soli]